MSLYYRTEFGGNSLQGGYLRIGPPQIRSLPIAQPELSTTAGRNLYRSIIARANEMIEVNRRIRETATPDERQRLERYLEFVDDETEELVMRAYGVEDADLFGEFNGPRPQLDVLRGT
jgi:hypothetical protein